MIQRISPYRLSGYTRVPSFMGNNINKTDENSPACDGLGTIETAQAQKALILSDKKDLAEYIKDVTESASKIKEMEKECEELKTTFEPIQTDAQKKLDMVLGDALKLQDKILKKIIETDESYINYKKIKNAFAKNEKYSIEERPAHRVFNEELDDGRTRKTWIRNGKIEAIREFLDGRQLFEIKLEEEEIDKHTSKKICHYSDEDGSEAKIVYNSVYDFVYPNLEVFSEKSPSLFKVMAMDDNGILRTFELMNSPAYVSQKYEEILPDNKITQISALNGAICTYTKGELLETGEIDKEEFMRFLNDEDLGNLPIIYEKYNKSYNKKNKKVPSIAYHSSAFGGMCVYETNIKQGKNILTKRLEIGNNSKYMEKINDEIVESFSFFDSDDEIKISYVSKK